ncbi:hypothetical protein [Paenibacillus senegalensis]|uniref:hypothetical protein n=1 Tax=Paenibacillus senegalensis TaxID=1465766 RepID=UPI000287F0E4|nr:hypothetical protein [Paenibacillus senegalensis]
MDDAISKKMILDWIATRKSALEQVVKQHTGYHKRHLSGQHSALVDLEWEVESGSFDIKGYSDY